MPKKKLPPTTSPEEGNGRPLEAPPSGDSFPIAAIAASAGGLQAFKTLFSAMRADLGMAFVLVPHLDPTHASLMVDLLSRCTAMPVYEIRNGVRVQPDTIYIIPPNRSLEIKDGRLHLHRPVEPPVDHTPQIDSFFRSLADDQRERAVGIVLSGTGLYGTLGLQAIKANGGLTIVQDPSEAEYGQMPRSAISSGVADHILRTADMPEVLAAYGKHSYITTASTPSEAAPASDYLSRIIALLQSCTKYNFDSYRKRMLTRRTQRRMSINHIEDPNRYIKLLQQSDTEAGRLAQDFLIAVSSFFRDPEAYAVFERLVIPDLIQRKAGGDAPIRVWIPGCATGEEAYSIAMVLSDAITATGKPLSFQIFATDINEKALKFARSGIYPEGIAADVSPERLKRFFTKTGHHYRVSKQLRETVMFASQNVISDISFSRLDLISCRNVLIYFEPEVQRRIIALFHFALNKDGYLFLGTSEPVGTQTNLFEVLNKKWRIFKRLGPSHPGRVQFPSGDARALHLPDLTPRNPSTRVSKIDYLAQQLLLSNFAPACVLINRAFEILYAFGPINQYISVPPGRATLDLLAMAHKGLSSRIRALSHRARDSRDGTSSGDVHLNRGGGSSVVRIQAKEVRQPKELEGLLLLSFEDLPAETAVPAVKPVEPDNKNPLVRQLQTELKVTRDDLQSTIEELQNSNEELQDSNEELKSSNEELMSMTEELQSVNEELETSKEELQSVNEELNTVNNQLEEKIDELDEANNDITNLLNSTEIATIFLDRKLRIRRFTPSTAKLLNLMPADVGRSIKDFALKLQDDTLIQDAGRVLDKSPPVDRHLWTDDGLCYLRRILPYRTAERQNKGIVVTFVDITAQMAAIAESERLAVLLKDSNDAIIMNDLDGRIHIWNRGAEHMYGYSETEALEMRIDALAPAGDKREFRTYMAGAVKGTHMDDLETRRQTKDGRLIDISLTATRLMNDEGQVIGIMATERDITSRKRMEYELRSLNRELEQRVEERTAEVTEKVAQLHQREHYLSAVLGAAPDAFITMDSRGTIKSCNPTARRMFGCMEKEEGRINISVFFPFLAQNEEDDNFIESYLKRSKLSAGRSLREAAGRHRDGTPLTMEMSITKIGDYDLYVAFARDISERKVLEREVIEASTREQERIGREIHDGLGQRLTALTMMAASIEKRLAAKNGNEAGKMEELRTHLEEALAEARALSRGLAPVPEFTGGLRSAIKSLVRDLKESSGTNIHLKLSRSSSLEDSATDLQLYRIAQEAISNALKHSKAKIITVEMTTRRGCRSLKISDDGSGISFPELKHDGIGLHIMRYRADIIGATFEIHSEKGKGTTVVCTLPKATAGRR